MKPVDKQTKKTPDERRPEDIGGMGEGFFRLIAKDARFVVNQATEDKAGWDFVIEEPSPLFVDYSQQNRPLYRVQVKSTTRTIQSATMTFSSLLSLIQFSGPAFILLLRFDASTTPVAARIVHIDEALAIDILTTLRKKQVSTDELKPNKARYTVSTRTGHQLEPLSGHTLRAALENPVDGPYLDYIDAKSKWLRKLEDEATLWRAKVRLENEQAVRDMADSFLGYARPFNAASTWYMAPFGIPDNEVTPPTEFSPAEVRPLEEELQTGTVLLRTERYGTAYEFRATVYATPLQIPRFASGVRYRTALFDLVHRDESEDMQFVSSDFSDRSIKVSVKELYNFLAYFHDLGKSRKAFIELTLDTGDRSPIFEVSVDILSSTNDDLMYLAIAATYKRFAQLGLVDELIIPDEFISHPGHFQFFQHIGTKYDPVMTFEFDTEGDENASEDVNVVIFVVPISLVRITVFIYGAFFGSLERVGGGKYCGTFTHSEYLSQLIVPVDVDATEVKKEKKLELETQLSERGFKSL